MNWKFWKKTGTDVLPKPKELTSDLGKYLVVDLQYDPDWVWQLKMVTDLPKDGTANFRVYDPARVAMQGLTIKNYTSLDGHQGLILFDGWVRKQTRELEVNDYHQALKADPAV
jgi:hypothetical protein